MKESTPYNFPWDSATETWKTTGTLCVTHVKNAELNKSEGDWITEVGRSKKWGGGGWSKKKKGVR